MYISAVIPVWNPVVSELDEALLSLKKSKLVDEVILVDDHSSTKEAQVALQKYSELGYRVIQSRVVRNTSAARATGIQAAKGDFILNMDHDDLIYNESFNRNQLAPINLAKQNSPWKVSSSIWEFLNDPGAIQWGSVVETNLARAIAADAGQCQEDIAWGYRLLLAAWKYQIPVVRESGIRYHWRSAVGRNSVTTYLHSTLSHEAYLDLLSQHLDQAIQHLDLSDDEANFIRAWDRRKDGQPVIRSVDNQARVDTHVLSYLGNLPWLKQCLASLDAEPTNLQLVIGGFPSSIGQARAYAFTLGTAEYVSFLDDDDYALPGAMAQCVSYLDEHPDCVGVYTDRYHLHADGHQDAEVLNPWHWRRMYHEVAEVTHLKVMRRSAVVPYLGDLAQWPTFEEYVLCGLMANDGYWHHLPIFGAVKRFKSYSESSMRLAKPGLLEQAKKRVLPSLKRHW